MSRMVTLLCVTLPVRHQLREASVNSEAVMCWDVQKRMKQYPRACNRKNVAQNNVAQTLTKLLAKEFVCLNMS